MSTVTPIATHKRGASFGLAATYPLPPGTWTATARVETASGELVQALTCTLSALAALNADGHTAALAITADADDTLAWPVKTLACDIVFSDTAGNVLKTETFYIRVQTEVT